MSNKAVTERNGEARARVRVFVDSARFRGAILFLIGLNAVTLGLETSRYAMDAAGPYLILADRAMLAVFVAELTARIYAHGWRFFRDPWSVFDFVIVAIALLPASEAFSALRALRILRTLRLVSGIPRLRRVVEALLHAVPGIGSISMLLLLVFYVFGVIATKLFGGRFPDWFGTIGESMYSLFQIMTLESWSMGIVRPVMEVYPWAWAFFVPFIIVSSFTVLNLFIAIIVDSMQIMHREEEERTVSKLSDVVHEDSAPIAAELAALRREVAQLRSELHRNGD